ncbi:MAG TPA: sensor histidine kinase, partial [Actinomycetota bacterium]|nr:sensor histidine kinase [Actinomycetota bacterium]
DAFDDALAFEVADDGDGFDPAVTGYGTGLQGMADRLETLGGSLEVRSAPGTGTSIGGRVEARDDREVAGQGARG